MSTQRKADKPEKQPDALRTSDRIGSQTRSSRRQTRQSGGPEATPTNLSRKKCSTTPAAASPSEPHRSPIAAEGADTQPGSVRKGDESARARPVRQPFEADEGKQSPLKASKKKKSSSQPAKERKGSAKPGANTSKATPTSAQLTGRTQHSSEASTRKMSARNEPAEEPRSVGEAPKRGQNLQGSGAVRTARPSTKNA